MKLSIYQLSDKLRSPDDYIVTDAHFHLNPESSEKILKFLKFSEFGTLLTLLNYPHVQFWTAGRLTRTGKDGIEACQSNLKKLLGTEYIEYAKVPSTFGWMYLIEANINGTLRYKIGESKEPYSRFDDIQAVNPSQLTLKHLVLSNNCKKLEGLIHKLNEAYRIQIGYKKGEWFELPQSQVNQILAMGGDRNV